MFLGFFFSFLSYVDWSLGSWSLGILLLLEFVVVVLYAGLKKSLPWPWFFDLLGFGPSAILPSIIESFKQILSWARTLWVVIPVLYISGGSFAIEVFLSSFLGLVSP